MSTDIKIAIADDHPMIIDGLKTMLALYPHITIVGSYLTGTSLLKGLEEIVPDVLLLDIQLPDKTGDELAPIIVKKYPEIKILTLTNFDNVLYANNMFQHGALGYLLKTTDKDLLIQAIETVYKGEKFVEYKIRDKIHELNIHHVSKVRLTQREKDILKLIMRGVETTEIAKTLFISINTVKSYRKNILRKLDVNNTAALVQKALIMGLVE
jgi:DNA-binding NarL/FixJ family response regulator